MCLTQSCNFRTTGLKISRHFLIQSEVKPNPFAHIFPRFASATGGPGERGHIVADSNVSPFVRARNICCGHKKMFLILFRNILCPQQMFPSLRSPRNIMGNNVSSFNRALNRELTATGTSLNKRFN